MKLALLFLIVVLIGVSSAQQALVCENAQAFCGQTSFFAGTTGAAVVGPEYGCLDTQPAPAWFYFQIASGNNVTIDFSNSNNVDIDFAIWGPFTSPNCSLVETGSLAPINCSYSTSSDEQALLLDVNPGEVYLLLITNFAEEPTIITATVDTTNTNAELDCSIVSPTASPVLPTPSLSVEPEICTNSISICTPVVVENLGRNLSALPGPDFGCLREQYDPLFFYFRIATGGNFVLRVTPLSVDSDLDYALWGPFNSPDCANVVNNDPLTCSYSSRHSEYAVINSTQAGDYYIGVVSNFGRNPTDISIGVVAGSAQLDCGIFPSPPPVFFDVCGDGEVTGNEACDFGNAGPNFYLRRCCDPDTCRFNFPGSNCAVRNANPCRTRTCGVDATCIRNRLPRNQCRI